MIVLNKWPGLVTNASPYSIPPGATVEQVNVQCLIPGELTVRPGFQAVSFAVNAGNTQPVVRAFRYQHGSGEHIVYQSADGAIYSSAVAAVESGDYAPPTAPSIASAIPGPLSISVSVSAPSASGSAPVSGYSFQVSSDNKITWKAAGSSSSANAALSNLTAGSSYYVRAAAINQYGSSEYGPPYGAVSPTAVVAQTVPSVPQSVTAVAGNAVATVRWTAPASTGGADITYYSVQMSRDRGVTWALAGTTGLLAFDATSLLNQTDYIFRVAATNSVGTSAYSSPSASVTTSSAITVPSAPAAGSNASSSTTITVNWTAPASNGGSAITGYTVEYKLLTDASWTATSTAGTTYVLTGLTPSTTYALRVAAVNASGTGAYTEWQAGTIAAFTPTAPDAPQNLSVSANYISYTASWSAPATNGGASITSYRLERGTSASGPWTIESDSLATSFNKSVSIPGGVVQYFRVAAKNSVGYGPYATAAATAVSPPSAPQNLSVTYDQYATAASAGNATVAWGAPSSTGGLALTTYDILWSTASGRQIIKAGISATSSSLSQLVKLPESSSGTLVVSACNSLGCTEASVSTTVPALRTAPLIPTIVSAARAGNTVALTFSPNSSETAANLLLVNNGGLTWFAEYSIDAGATYTPVLIGVGSASPGVYSGTYTSWRLANGTSAIEYVILRISLAVMTAQGDMDTSKPRSPWAYTSSLRLPLLY